MKQPWKYGCFCEKLEAIDGQLTLDMIFNEAEALTANLYVAEPTDNQIRPPNSKKKSQKTGIVSESSSHRNYMVYTFEREAE